MPSRGKSVTKARTLLSLGYADFELIGMALALVILLGVGKCPQLRIPFRSQ